jgi:hypothetical protein
MYYTFFFPMAVSKKKVSGKRAPVAHTMSPIVQFGVVFIILAAMALVAFVYKNYL